jgi:alkylated DNA repair dioxygenase AlkB
VATTYQRELFAAGPSLPEGFIYQEGFLTVVQEAALLQTISGLSLEGASYKQWTAKRRIVSYGGRYDFGHNRLQPAEPIPDFLDPLRRQVSEWTAIPASHFTHGMISEYRPGTQLGWHRDVPDFESVVGVSLGGPARMRFRPYPPATGRGRALSSLELQPRSAYSMNGAARWQWQHAISPTKALRYSITFRTLARKTSPEIPPHP